MRYRINYEINNLKYSNTQIKMKRLYEQAISKNQHLDDVIGDSIPIEELKQIKYNLNIEAVNRLRIFR